MCNTNGIALKFRTSGEMLVQIYNSKVATETCQNLPVCEKIYHFDLFAFLLFAHVCNKTLKETLKYYLLNFIVEPKKIVLAGY